MTTLKDVVKKLKELTDETIVTGEVSDAYLPSIETSLNQLVDVEIQALTQANKNYLGIISSFKVGFASITQAILETSAASKSQRMKLATQSKMLAEKESRRQARAEKEARQEEGDLKPSATGIKTEAFEKGATGKGGGILGFLGGAVGTAIGKGVEGLLTGLGKGLEQISNVKYLIGAGVLIALGGALGITGIALKEFVGIDFKQVALGVATLGILAVGAKLLGKASKQILIGALAIAALGASLIPAGFAFSMFADINWKGVGIGIGVLTLLGAAAFGLSFISPAIFIGAAAIAALGVAMIPAAYAFNLFGEALAKMSPFIEAFGDAVAVVIGAVGAFLTGFIDSLIRLGDSGPGLIVAGTGIAAVAAALIAFGGSSAIGGLLNFFGGDPIKKFIELADKGSELNEAAKGINSIADSFEKIKSDKLEDMTDSLDRFIDKLKELSKLKLEDISKLFKSVSETQMVDSRLEASRARGFGEMVVAMMDNLDTFFESTLDTIALTSAGKRLEEVTDMFETLIENLSSSRDEGGLLLPADSVKNPIPLVAPVGEALSQAGSVVSSNSVTIVNNNSSGGNVTNNSTSTRVTRSTSASPAILSGSAMGAM